MDKCNFIKTVIRDIFTLFIPQGYLKGVSTFLSLKLEQTSCLFRSAT